MERKVREDAKYSQECIVDAFLILLGEKNLQDITVTEICKKAGVARITFYKYSKISALLLIPYLIWVSFAAYLNFGYLVLN